jgi:uncharacterized membrane protein YqhA
MNLKNISDRELIWYVGIHMMFVVSGVFMALTDKLSGEGHKSGKADKGDGHGTGGGV